MSLAIQTFFDKASQSPELQQKIVAIYRRSEQTVAEELAALARESGSELTAADFLSPEGELSESQLSDVAGGFSWTINRKVPQSDGTFKIVRETHNNERPSSGLPGEGPLSFLRPDISMIP